MNNVRVTSGPAEVIATGAVIAFRGHPITIEFGGREEQLKVIFRFVDETGDGKARIDGKVLDAHTLEVTLFNFKNPLGTGTTQPIPIGSLADRQIYIHFRAYGLDQADRTLHFTVFREIGEARNG